MSPNSGRGRSNSPKPQSGTPGRCGGRWIGRDMSSLDPAMLMNACLMIDPPRGGTVVTTSRNAPGPFLQHEVFLSAMCLFVNAVEGNKYAFHFSHLFPSITKRDQSTYCTTTTVLPLCHVIPKYVSSDMHIWEMLALLVRLV